MLPHPNREIRFNSRTFSFKNKEEFLQFAEDSQGQVYEVMKMEKCNPPSPTHLLTGGTSKQ